MADPYYGREQTQSKHFILKHYLQALAFKVLTFSDITFVDGFSGPWQTKAENFQDSSFMIAMSVLQDAQRQIEERTKIRRKIKCFFSETDPQAFRHLENAVAPFHKPIEAFEIKTFRGKFEDAIPDIQSFIGSSFPLIFIDPTGWTGYPFDKIGTLFHRRKCEVLINFMYEFINRFANSDDDDIVSSLDPILGGPGWRNRLDTSLPRGPAVEKLFRENLKSVGDFEFVVSTRIDKATAERPHFFIAYGTKSLKGLIAFRDTEYKALRAHAKNRAQAKGKKREAQTNTFDMFSQHHAEVQEASIDQIVDEQKILAANELVRILSKSSIPFSRAVSHLLQIYVLRETNIKDICIDLAKAGRIENSWGSGNRKPRHVDLIALRALTAL